MLDFARKRAEFIVAFIMELLGNHKGLMGSNLGRKTIRFR